VIAATHQNLESRVRQGAFREDLFHRLNVIRLRLPPLRERREDIGVLARFFLQRSATELGVETKRLSEAALAQLLAFDFPGNVRQLENICHWLSVMAPSQVVEAKDLPQELLQPTASAELTLERSEDAPATSGEASAAAAPQSGAHVPAAAPLPGAGVASEAWVMEMAREARRLLAAGEPEVWELLSRRFEASLITAALELTHGRRIEAAQKLGIGRNTITRKIQELNLDV